MKRARLLVLLSIVASLNPPEAAARDFNINFGANAPLASTTAVWNLAAQRIQLPLVVNRDPSTPGREDDAVNIGSGKDGSFTPDRYALFDLSGGADATKITLDSSRVYEFVDFNLAGGVTLRGSGVLPLRILVQGNVTVSGIIELTGQPGQNAGASANPLGGGSSCGGQTGGAGGIVAGNVAPTNGMSAAGSGGGLAGVNAGGLASGGGGAGYFAAGIRGASAGGNPGTTYGDSFIANANGALLLPFAGSGGGGGGASSGIPISGAGGGGGGGAIVMNAGGNIYLASTGRILAVGGAGGSDGGMANAGPGGGGSGGAIRLFCGGTIIDDGQMHAEGGNGGGVAAGGGGSSGYTRFVSGTGTITGLGTENPSPATPVLGQTFYTTQPKTLVSIPFDTGNSAPEYNAVIKGGTFPSGTTVAYEYAGSSDAFVTDDTGFVPESSLAQLNGKRYFRFRLTMQTSVPAFSPLLQKMTVQITDHTQDAFAFKQAGCARVGQTGDDDERNAKWGFGFLLAYLILLPRLRRRNPR